MKHGEEFAADLEQLLAVARVDLPHLAYVYTDVHNRISHTSRGEAKMFGGCDALARIEQRTREEWADLRDELQGVLGDTSKLAESGADALLRIVDCYADTDHAAKVSLERVWGVDHDDVPSFINGSDEKIPSDIPRLTGD